MASPSDKTVNPLDLPEEILSMIVENLFPTPKYKLYSCFQALNFVSLHKNLQTIFATKLTRITPLTENFQAYTLSEGVYERLVKMAGPYLRELHLPVCSHAYLKNLPELCPNLEVLQVNELQHYRGWRQARVCFDHGEFSDSDFYQTHHSGNSSDDDDNDNVLVVIGYDGDNKSDHQVSSSEESHDDTGEDKENRQAGSSQKDTGHETGDDERSNKENCGDDRTDSKRCENHFIDHDHESNDHESSDHESSDHESSDHDSTYDEDSDGDYSENSESDDDIRGITTVEISHDCNVIPMLNRLKLRRLSITEPPKIFFELLKNHTLQELELHRLQKSQLAPVIPLLSEQLKSLTVSIISLRDNSERICNFVDNLIPIVPRLCALKLHVLPNPENKTEVWIPRDPACVDFPNRAPLLVANIRKNSCKSECKSVDLRGEATFRVLPAVNKDAAITLSCATVTVRDEGEGARVTSIPLQDEFLDVEVAHLKKAYLVRPSREFAFGSNLKWNQLLNGHLLKAIRTDNLEGLEELRLSTETLEIFGPPLPLQIDWSFLSGVQELYLLRPLNCSHRHGRVDEDDLLVIQALPPMVDAFQGEFIFVDACTYPKNVECPRPEEMEQYAKETEEAVERFFQRGGDAVTVLSFVDAVRQFARQ